MSMSAVELVSTNAERLTVLEYELRTSGAEQGLQNVIAAIAADNARALALMQEDNSTPL